jgi:hypothetical protein
MNEFLIEIKYHSDSNSQNTILSELQKRYSGWKNTAILNRYSFDYTIKNSDVELLFIDSVNNHSLICDRFKVIYNQNKHGYSEKDSESVVYNFVKESIIKNLNSEYNVNKLITQNIK